jgi:Fe-S-cluster-containing hydrogenase component 2
VDAIGRNDATGAVEVERSRCVGGKLCHRYCPIGVVGVDPDLKKSVKCDLCKGTPQCVAACPTGALELATRTGVAPNPGDAGEVDHG